MQLRYTYCLETKVQKTCKDGVSFSSHPISMWQIESQNGPKTPILLCFSLFGVLSLLSKIQGPWNESNGWHIWYTFFWGRKVNKLVLFNLKPRESSQCLPGNGLINVISGSHVLPTNSKVPPHGTQGDSLRLTFSSSETSDHCSSHTLDEPCHSPLENLPPSSSHPPSSPSFHMFSKLKRYVLPHTEGII